tara:strand:+ start:1833 stop:3398 length:1566 start_codon:yes stop_codon:yes gene_type:complete
MINHITKNNFILSSLLLLFPISLISGPLIPELIMNVVSIIFAIRLINDKDSSIFHTNFFYYYLFFVIYIILNAYFSSYRSEIFFKNLFYFRFLIFVFAVYYIFLKNYKIIKLLNYVLIFMCSILILDGFTEFYLGKNLLGNSPINRPDRIASLFGDRLVLGSFLAKFFFLILGLFFFVDQKSKIFKYYSIIIIFLAYILIFFTGERTAFISTSMGIIIFFICSNFSINRKIFTSFFLIIIISFTLFKNHTLYDRHIQQSIRQVNLNIFNNEESFFNRFTYYSTTYQTAYNAFSKKKLFGYGPKSFRHFCSEDDLKVIYPVKRKQVNTLLTFIVDRKYRGMRVTKLYVSSQDKISIDDLILSYEYNNNIYDFRSNREGIITSLTIKPGDFIENHHKLLYLDISDTSLPDNQFFDVNGCTTHPHNFYLQLLSETGILGTLFILLNFLYLVTILIKFLYRKLFKNIIELNNTKICLIINFIVFLFPFLPSGNLFNNWLNMTILIQISFYLFIFNKGKLMYEDGK